MMEFDGKHLDEDTVATAVRLCRENGFERMIIPFIPSKAFELAIRAILNEREIAKRQQAQK